MFFKYFFIFPVYLCINICLFSNTTHFTFHIRILKNPTNMDGKLLKMHTTFGCATKIL